MALNIGNAHLSLVLMAIEAKRHPEIEDLLAVIQDGNAPDEVVEYITMLYEGRGFIGTPSPTRTEKSLDKLNAHTLIYSEIEKERRNGNTISPNEAINRIAKKKIDGFGKSKLWEYWKG